MTSNAPPAPGSAQGFASRLSSKWRADAGVLKRRGAPEQAAAIESCVAELETEARRYELEALTLEDAAAESGYSYSALQKMVNERRVPNAGDKHKPRIRRGDLPKKAGKEDQAVGEPDLAEMVMNSKH